MLVFHCHVEVPVNNYIFIPKIIKGVKLLIGAKILLHFEYVYRYPTLVAFLPVIVRRFPHSMISQNYI